MVTEEHLFADWLAVVLSMHPDFRKRQREGGTTSSDDGKNYLRDELSHRGNTIDETRKRFLPFKFHAIKKMAIKKWFFL